MNYRHTYHAGGFSDVFKHIVLVALIQALLRKEKPFCYLDTHAGIGSYDLFAQEAQKSQEFQNGIAKIFKQMSVPSLVADYLAIVKNFNKFKQPKKLDSKLPSFYPGSPCIVQSLLRKSDRMILTELHASDVEKLKQVFLRNRQVAVYHEDGYQALKAFLPPKERRGLVLIDPPYEKEDEFKQIIVAIKNALQRWQTGIYAIWYPVKDKMALEKFYRSLKNCDAQKILIAELSVYPKDTQFRLNGSGMVIINPPWQLDKMLKEIMPWLWSVLSINKMGGYAVEWVVQES